MTGKSTSAAIRGNHRIRVFIAHQWPLLALLATNLSTFWPHYLGRATFPWDFVGGYHTQSFGWFDNGSVFAPPAWFPWGEMGFPSFLALQSGAWYAPLALLDAVGVVYTIHVATMVQVLHVLAGALGVYALLRQSGCSRGVALLGGIAFHFGAAFYSNQQHVDIVRAAALFPWLLYVLRPDFLAKRWALLAGADGQCFAGGGHRAAIA